MLNKLKFIFTIILLGWYNSCLANTPFMKGNEAYQNGDYSTAISHYNESLQSSVSSEQYYNLGNAYYKTSQYGEAILHYLKAQTLSPKDPAIASNLNLSYKAVGIEPSTPFLLHRIAYLFSINTWTWLFFSSLWIFLSMVVLAKVLRVRVVLIGILLFATGIIVKVSAAALIGYHFEKNKGIIVKNEATLKIAPADSSPALLTLKEGSTGKSVRRHEDYFYIHFAKSKEGWVHNSDFRLIWQD